MQLTRVRESDASAFEILGIASQYRYILFSRSLTTAVPVWDRRINGLD